MAKAETDKPALYSLDANAGVIDIFIPKSVAPTAADFDLERLNSSSRAFFDIPAVFTPPNADREWGYGQVLAEHESPNPDWIKLVCALPAFTKQGTDWDAHRNTVATFRVLFDYFDFTDKKSDADLPQMLSVSMDQRKIHEKGANIGAEITPSLCKYIEKVIERGVSGSVEQEIATTMFDAYSKMIQGTRNPREFRAELIRPFIIKLNSPHVIQTGTLYPSNFNPQKGIGYELLSRDIDSSQQQLSFLAGLAKLSHLAARDYKAKT